MFGDKSEPRRCVLRKGVVFSDTLVVFCLLLWIIKTFQLFLYLIIYLSLHLLLLSVAAIHVYFVHLISALISDYILLTPQGVHVKVLIDIKETGDVATSWETRCETGS